MKPTRTPRGTLCEAETDTAGHPWDCYRVRVGHGACLGLPRVLALVGGLGLVAAFFMPWFSSQGLLLSGQFLHEFLVSAGPAELRRFLPASSPTEVALLRALVDLFPAAGAVAALASLVGGLVGVGRLASNVVLGLSGLVPLVGWAVGIGRLPPDASPQVGLWLIALGAVAVLLGLGLDLWLKQTPPSGQVTNPPAVQSQAGAGAG